MAVFQKAPLERYQNATFKERHKKSSNEAERARSSRNVRSTLQSQNVTTVIEPCSKETSKREFQLNDGYFVTSDDFKHGS